MLTRSLWHISTSAFISIGLPVVKWRTCVLFVYLPSICCIHSAIAHTDSEDMLFSFFGQMMLVRYTCTCSGYRCPRVEMSTTFAADHHVTVIFLCKDTQARLDNFTSKTRNKMKSGLVLNAFKITWPARCENANAWPGPSGHGGGTSWQLTVNKWLPSHHEGLRKWLARHIMRH